MTQNSSVPKKALQSVLLLLKSYTVSLKKYAILEAILSFVFSVESLSYYFNISFQWHTL